MPPVASAPACRARNARGIRLSSSVLFAPSEFDYWSDASAAGLKLAHLDQAFLRMEYDNEVAGLFAILN